MQPILMVESVPLKNVERRKVLRIGNCSVCITLPQEFKNLSEVFLIKIDESTVIVTAKNIEFNLKEVIG